MAAFVGTLRLLGPLIITRRTINTIGDIITDYLTGRYFRKTYTKVETIYLNYYETPAAFRAFCRTFSQLLVYALLKVIMGWLVGIGHTPCRSQDRGLAFLCSLLWIGTVVGTGHAFATALAIWGGPLRIQAGKTMKRSKRYRIRFILSRPWQILKVLQDPEAWITNYRSDVYGKPFENLNKNGNHYHGNHVYSRHKNYNSALIFPSTWIPLRILHICAVAKVMSTEPPKYRWCSQDNDQISALMKQYLIQHALSDEWYRVFLGEKRVGLGIFIGFSYIIAITWSVVTSARMNGTAALVMIPSLLASMVSGYINIVIFWENKQLEYKRKRGFNFDRLE